MRWPFVPFSSISSVNIEPVLTKFVDDGKFGRPLYVKLKDVEFFSDLVRWLRWLLSIWPSVRGAFDDDNFESLSLGNKIGWDTVRLVVIDDVLLLLLLPFNRRAGVDELTIAAGNDIDDVHVKDFAFGNRK